MSECICEFGDGCGGMGVIHCDGCGGDLCVCAACFGNGEMDCPGCELCWCDDDEAADAAAEQQP